MTILIKILFVSFFFILTSCNDIKKSMGMEKDVPDEFLVKKSKPLSKPPNYELLPPDTINEKNNSAANSSNDNVKSLINNSLNKNSQNQEKNDIKAEGQSDIENTILKELSK